MKPLQMEQRKVELADGTGLVYHCAGRGLPVLLVNGLGGPREVWRSLITQLSDRYRFLCWDYRGLGASSDEVAAIGVSGHAADACAILDAEKITRASLVGWSFGVQVALEVFRHVPDKVASLVLINGAARVAWADGSAQPLSGKVMARALRVMQRSPRLVGNMLRGALHSPEAFTWARRVGLLGEHVSADSFAEITRALRQVDVHAYLELLERSAAHDTSDVLRQVDVPTLVIAGDRDPFTRRAAMEELVHEIAGAEYLLLPGATHYVLLDHAERVNLRIEKFWNERGYRGEARLSSAPSMPPSVPQAPPSAAPTT